MLYIQIYLARFREILARPFCYDKASGVEVMVCLLRQGYYDLDRRHFATTKLGLLAAERMRKQFLQLDDCFE